MVRKFLDTRHHRQRATMAEARAIQAERALSIVYAGCGPRLWRVYTRGTELAGLPPPHLPKPAKPRKRQRSGKALHAILALVITTLGVTVC